jgi:hypothetical protein
MKAPPFPSAWLDAVVFTLASLLLPELDTFLGAFHWTRVSAGALFNAKTALDVFGPAAR